MHSQRTNFFEFGVVLYFIEQQLMSQGYNPHPSLYGVYEQQTSRSVDLLILLLDVA